MVISELVRGEVRFQKMNWMIFWGKVLWHWGEWVIYLWKELICEIVCWNKGKRVVSCWELDYFWWERIILSHWSFTKGSSEWFFGEMNFLTKMLNFEIQFLQKKFRKRLKQIHADRESLSDVHSNFRYYPHMICWFLKYHLSKNLW